MVQSLSEFTLLDLQLQKPASNITLPSGVLKKHKEEHEQFKKDTINTDKVELQKHEAVERYPQ